MSLSKWKDKNMTVFRSKIPAEVARDVLIESGHRCAVCGSSASLEKAHIVSWAKSKSHNFDNLICLCAGCHQRADLEKWGPKTLRKYKEKPWVKRTYENIDFQLVPTQKVKIEIDMDFEDFNDKNKDWLTWALASFLHVSPTSVQIISVQQIQMQLFWVRIIQIILYQV